MSKEEIEKLIDERVQDYVAKYVKAEESNLSVIIEKALLYTGEYSRCSRLMDAFKLWKSKHVV